MSDTAAEARHAAPNPPGGADVFAKISHHALLAGLCQFIPIPFADDAVELRVRRAMVKKLLDNRGVAYPHRQVEALWEGPPSSLAAKAGGFAKSLLLKPLKKVLRTVLLFLTVRRAILTAAEVLLLGHTVDRLVADGRLGDAAPAAERTANAIAAERAVREVIASPERRGIVKLVRESSRLLKGIRGEAERPDRPDATAAVDDDAAVEQSLSADERRRLEAASDELAGKLQDERGRSVLAQLDRQVDQRMRRIA